jgi:adenylosuccinate lyase
LSLDHESWQSPLSWRYGSPEMRALWSEAEKRRRMRRVWLALAEAQSQSGLVSAAQLAELRASVDRIDIDRATEIEATTRHDVMAEILCWGEQLESAAGILHLGATSADITDNVDAWRIQDSLRLLRKGLLTLIHLLAERVDEYADLVSLGWTHIQPAAPTTVGHRLAVALQDFMIDLEVLDECLARVAGKGFKGAVGSAASYQALLEGSGLSPEAMESAAMDRLGLRAAPITTQVYPRKLDWLAHNALAGIAGSASSLAFNIRLMQSPPFGEWSEGFEAGQVGSSAMPWKRNPINAENINSLARYVASMPNIAWQNETLCLLERTLDDSANRRLALPGAFLATDEILARSIRLSGKLVVEEGAVRANLARFGPFAATERVLLAAAGAGGDRQRLHECIRQHSMAAWQAVETGGANDLAERLASDPEILAWMDAASVRALVAAPEAHVGTAASRARALAARARALV